MDSNYTITARDRATKKRVVIESGLTKDAAKHKASHQPTWIKKLYKSFRSAKAK